MFCWFINIPLIFKILRRKFSRSFFHVKINSSKRRFSFCNIHKSLLKISFFVHFYFLGSLNEQLPLSSLWHYETLFLQLYLLQVEAWLLIKHGLSKHVDVQGQNLAKTFIIQFHLHLQINTQWVDGFKILHISCPFTNIKIHFMKSFSQKLTIINFAISETSVFFRCS